MLISIHIFPPKFWYIYITKDLIFFLNRINLINLFIFKKAFKIIGRVQIFFALIWWALCFLLDLANRCNFRANVFLLMLNLRTKSWFVAHYRMLNFAWAEKRLSLFYTKQLCTSTDLSYLFDSKFSFESLRLRVVTYFFRFIVESGFKKVRQAFIFMSLFFSIWF